MMALLNDVGIQSMVISNDVFFFWLNSQVSCWRLERGYYRDPVVTFHIVWLYSAMNFVMEHIA